MHSFHFKKLVFGLLVIFHGSIADNAVPSINTPTSLSSCSPTSLSISGGTPPYSLSIVEADNPEGPALQSLSNVQQQAQLALGSSIAPGTAVSFRVKDSQGKASTSGQITVSTNSICASSDPEGTAANDASSAASAVNPAGSTRSSSDPADSGVPKTSTVNSFASQNGTANPNVANQQGGNSSSNPTSGSSPVANPQGGNLSSNGTSSANSTNNTVPIMNGNTINVAGANTTAVSDATTRAPNATSDSSSQLSGSNSSTTFVNTTQTSPNNTPTPTNTAGLNPNNSNNSSSTFKPNVSSNNDLSFSFPHVLVLSSPLRSSSTHPSCSSHSSPPAPDLKRRAIFRRFESHPELLGECDNWAGELGKPRGDMDGLPRELCLKIFHLLDHQSLASSPQVCRKWRALTSDDELWRKLFNDRWGADAAAFYAPEGSKSWKDVFAVQDRCDRYGLIIREGKDYYLIYQGEIQRYLGSRQDTDGDCGEDAPRRDAGDEHRQISDRILFFLGDLEKACADAKRVKA